MTCALLGGSPWQFTLESKSLGQIIRARHLGHSLKAGPTVLVCQFGQLAEPGEGFGRGEHESVSDQSQLAPETIRLSGEIVDLNQVDLVNSTLAFDSRAA